MRLLLALPGLSAVALPSFIMFTIQFKQCDLEKLAFMWNGLHPFLKPVNKDVKSELTPYLAHFVTFFDKVLDRSSEFSTVKICPCPVLAITCTAAELVAVRKLIFEFEFFISSRMSTSDTDDIDGILATNRHLINLLSADLHTQH